MAPRDLTPGAVRRVVFVCYGNACRSPMAEAVGRARLPTGVVVASGGIVPLGRIPPEGPAALAEHGFDGAGLESKAVDDFDLAPTDLVVDLCGAWIPPDGFAGRIERWPTDDPYRRPSDAWRAVLEGIVRRVDELAARLRASGA